MEKTKTQLDKDLEKTGSRTVEPDHGHPQAKAIKESEQYFRDLADQAPTMIGVTDEKGHITFLNKTWLEFRGRTLEEEEGWAWAAGLHPEDRERVQAEMETCITQLKPYSIEYRIQDRYGKYHWLLDTAAPRFDDNGNPIGYIGTAINITDHKEIEHSLAVSGEKFRTLTENIPGVSYRCACDEHWTMEFISGEIEELSGYPQSDFLNNEIRSFASIIHPDDTKMAEDIVMEGVDKKQPYMIEYRIIRADGTVRWVFEKGQGVFDATNTLLWLDGVILDITERKHDEQELEQYHTNLEELVEKRTAELQQEVLEHKQSEEALKDSERWMNKTQEIANLGSWDFDLIKNKLSWSDQEYRIFGLTPQEFEVTYEIFLDIVHPDDRKLVDDAYSGSIRDGKDEYEVEHRIVQKSTGETRYVYEKCRHIRDESGKTIRSVGMTHDITERKENEELLIKTKETAEKASQAKSEFLSSMSHELRTPLNAILGFSQLLEMDKDIIALNKLNWVQEIRKGGEHLLSLIEDVLDLAKIEEGKLRIVMEDVQLQDTFDECRSLTSTLAVKNNVSIDFDNANNYIINCDRKRTKQALLNYISNAIKYNRDNGSVHIQCAPVEPHRLRISVSDTGYGLNEAQIEQLFQPFHRVGAQSAIVEGTGIGLALTKEIVEQMGGSVGVDSQPDEGSTFWLELNLAGDNLVASEKPDFAFSTHIDKAVTDEEKTNFTILYIEDNAGNLTLVEKLFEGYADYRLITALEPILGLELVSSTHPDLILLDINLPHMDGYEVLKHLRNDPIHQATPVVAISANAMPKDIDKAMAAGFDDYICKPVNLKKLMEIVEQMLSRKVKH